MYNLRGKQEAVFLSFFKQKRNTPSHYSSRRGLSSLFILLALKTASDSTGSLSREPMFSSGYLFTRQFWSIIFFLFLFDFLGGRGISPHPKNQNVEGVCEEINVSGVSLGSANNEGPHWHGSLGSQFHTGGLSV